MDSKKKHRSDAMTPATVDPRPATGAAEPVLDHGLLAWLAQFETMDRLHAFQDRGRWILRDGQVHRC